MFRTKIITDFPESYIEHKNFVGKTVNFQISEHILYNSYQSCFKTCRKTRNKAETMLYHSSRTWIELHSLLRLTVDSSILRSNQDVCQSFTGRF